MDINLSILDKYFDKRMPATVLIDIEEAEPCLTFQPGKDPNGSLRVFLSFKDIYDILHINGVYDAMKEWQSPWQHESEKKINDLIYDTLVKYVAQMLNASVGKILYPEITPLEKHKMNYFKNL